MKEETLIPKLKNWIADNDQFIRFALPVVILHFLWKIAFITPDEVKQTLIFGFDVTEALMPVSEFIAKTTRYFVDLFTTTQTFVYKSLIYYPRKTRLTYYMGLLRHKTSPHFYGYNYGSRRALAQ